MTGQRITVEVRKASGTVSPRGRVLILPGAGYGVDHPLLFWAAEVLAQRGWQVNAVRWDVSGLEGDPALFVEAAADELARQAPAAERTLVLGKSLGTHAAGWAADRGLPAVWLTPLVTELKVRNAIENSTNPTLAIGGSKDTWWMPLSPRQGLQVEEIDGADHSLHLPNWPDSLRALSCVMSSIERFAGSL